MEIASELIVYISASATSREQYTEMYVVYAWKSKAFETTKNHDNQLINDVWYFLFGDLAVCLFFSVPSCFDVFMTAGHSQAGASSDQGVSLMIWADAVWRWLPAPRGRFGPRVLSHDNGQGNLQLGLGHPLWQGEKERPGRLAFANLIGDLRSSMLASKVERMMFISAEQAHRWRGPRFWCRESCLLYTSPSPRD